MNGRLEVKFLDVGQGDSIVVRFPNGHVTLVDGGGIKGSDFDVGRNIVAPALLRMGIHRVDDMILTHPHHDHYKGLAYIAEKFRPDVLYTNGQAAPEDEITEWEDFLVRLKGADVPLRSVIGTGGGSSSLTVEEGGARLELFSLRPKDISLLDPNDGSLVIKITYKDRSIVLTGDLMDMGERMLLEARPDLSGDVLKVAHHGSETSTSSLLIEAVRPKIAVISVGENNQYGMPDEVVLKGLKNAGAEVYRTDLDGAVTISTDGKTVDVDTFVPKRFEF
jgi:competence protein ComEC